MKTLTFSLLLLASGCHDKVCPAVPLSGNWKGYEDAIPKGAVVCGPDKTDPRKLAIQFPDKTVHEAYLQVVDGVDHWAASGYDFNHSEYADIGHVNFLAKTADRPKQWIAISIEQWNLPNKSTYGLLELHRPEN
jgi:hypothetical protein